MGAGLQVIETRSIHDDRRWPLWDASCNAGSPAHANPLASYLLPLQWLFLFLPVARAANLFFISNIMLAGLSMLVAARRFSLSTAASVFCGIGYMLSYRYLALFDAGWLPNVTMYALAPSVFWAADNVLERPEPRRVACFAAVLALSAMQGSAQSFYYALLGLGAFVGSRLSSVSPAARSRVLMALSGGGLLALLLASPDLLPRAQFAALSSRTNFDYVFFLGKAPGWRDLATLFDPLDAGGMRVEYWESNFYFGLWLYPLALWGCLKDWKKSRYLLASVLVCLFLCFDSPVLKALFHYMPGFALFRMPTRMLQLAQLAGVLLAGVGVDALLRGLERRKAFAAAVCLCLLPVADSGARLIPRLGTKPLSWALPTPPFIEQLRRGETSGRVAAIGRHSIPYGTAAFHAIDMINGFQPLNLKHYIEYFFVLQTGRPFAAPRYPIVWTDLNAISKPEMLRALDVKHIVSDRFVALEGIDYEFVARQEDVPVYKLYDGIVHSSVFLWRDRKPLGPAYFASSLTPVIDGKKSLEAIAASTSALDAYVLGWEPGGGAALDFSGGRARMTRRGQNNYEYALSSRGTNFLIVSQVWYPGWRATLDGGEVPIFRVNHALMGLVVPPGEHSLRLEMTSPMLALGLGLALAATAVLGMMLLPNAVARR